MDDRQFRQLLEWFGLSWDGYRRVRKGVKKRVRRHMQELQCRDIDEYLATTGASTPLEEQCRLLLTVSVSRFFRDQGLWQALHNQVLPELISRKCSRLRVWSAGCARGEEIYSLKILWDLAASRFATVPTLEAWATDINPEYLEAARRGVYSASSLRELPTGLKERYFQPIGQKPLFALRASVKQGISWKVMDLLRDDPPADEFQLVFLRNNLLTYYDQALLQPALDKVAESLAPAGYLIIGAKEKLPQAACPFLPCPAHAGLFLKVSSRNTVSTNLPMDSFLN